MFTSLSCTFLNSTDTMPSPYSGDGFSFCISSTSIFAISANICHWSTDNLDITEIRRCLKSGSPLSRSPKNAESSSFRLLCKNIGSAPFFNQKQWLWLHLVKFYIRNCSPRNSEPFTKFFLRNPQCQTHSFNSFIHMITPLLH